MKQPATAYIETIRSNYAAMPDEALTELWKERKGLTDEALHALKSELANRSLLHEDQQFAADSALPGAHADPAKRYSRNEMKAFWQLVMNLKLNGKPGEVILGSLQVKGMSLEEAVYMLREIEPAVIERINQADSDRLGALIRLCCGIAVIVITMLASLGNAMYFTGWMLIALSIVQTAIASSVKSRYQLILENIYREESEAGTTGAEDDE